jgi:hypothetical protein
MEDVTGATATELVPTGPGDLVEQLNDARSRWPMWPVPVVILAIALIANPIVGGIAAVLLVPAAIWLFFHDRARRSVVAFYDVNDETAEWFDELVSAFEQLSQANRIWRITTSGQVQTTQQRKVHGGAGTIVSRGPAQATLTGPAGLVTNIAVPTLNAGNQGLHFLPDRILVRNGKRFSDIAYSHLQLSTLSRQFVEDGAVPMDAQKVTTTWQYVNVKGGPDLRYKNNRQLPVMLYEDVTLTTAEGLHWLLQVSNIPAAENVVARLQTAPKTALGGRN